MTKKVTRHRFSKILVATGGHLLATLTLFIVFVSAFFTEYSFGLVPTALHDEQLRPDIVGPGLLILALAGCAWALMFILYQLVRSRVHQTKHVQLKKAKGTVIAETLIVFPVFLCLTFGLAQTALSSIAGILTTLASYEITRGLAVWSVEEGNNRAPGGAPSKAKIQRMMRLQAASIVAPATPEFSLSAPCNIDPEVQSMLNGMAGAGLSNSATGQGSVFSMAEGFGHRTFAQRGPTKVLGAYCNISVDWTDVNTRSDWTGRSDFTTRLAFTYPAMMPVVAWVFAGDPNSGTWNTPYTTIIERSYNMRTYLTPNICLPYDAGFPGTGGCSI